ncbi:MAG: phosphoribosylformylglycinamidine cyclo-ligase [Brockia lithotrophica]|nr:phosphoribosylformylglycinamidine cyclo-ligase [Brockia lithotrophica]
MERPREPGSGASGYAEAYRRAGVDLDRGAEVVRRVAELVRGTHGPEVLRGIGAFAGAIRLPDGLDDPVLFASADGVGTKLLLAQAHGRLEVAGWDLVAMNVNDLAAEGAQPLFFLDYVAMGRLDPDAIERLIAGMVDALREVGAVLLGGETAELPGMLPEGSLELAGFAVGVAPRASLARPAPAAGDLLLGLASSGFHANGYSLLRALLARDPDLFTPEELLTPTRLYVRQAAAAFAAGAKAAAHITGGGFPENLARVFPSTLAAEVAVEAWEVPEIFRRAQAAANLDDREAYAVWNQGIGFVFVVAPERLGDVRRALEDLGEHPVVLGRLVEQGQGGEGGAVRFRYGGHLPA